MLTAALHDDHVNTWCAWHHGQARHFLARLDPEAESFTFQAFDDAPTRRRDLARVAHGDFDYVADQLERLQEQRAGVFVTVNTTDGKGRQAHNITHVRAVFVDLDGAPLNPVIAAGLEPHIVVESSPGRFHAYWLVDDCPLNQFESVQRALARRFGGDPSVHDLSRVMRLPGFRHFKKDARTCQLLDGIGTTAPPYRLAEIVDTLKLELDTPEERPRARMKSDAGVIAPGNRHAHLFAVGRSMALRSTPDAVRAALAAENQARCDPPLAQADIDYLAERAFTAKDAEGWEAPIDLGKIKDAGAWTSDDALPHQWSEPLPLPTGMPEVAPFDFALLPDSLQPWARDICELIQCPLDFVAVAIMTALGSVIGRKVAIRPQAQTDWTEVANMWAMVVGRPGVLKSPAVEAALGPVRRLAARAAAEFEAALAGYELATKVTKIQANLMAKAATDTLAKDPKADVRDMLRIDAADEPVLRRYYTTDSTAAALGELLRQNPNGLLVHRDELVSLLRSLDQEDNASARGFYLTAWNGNSPYTTDRIGRGMNLHIEAVCLSILGSTQPGRIAEYLHHAVRGGKGDDGLMQRFGLLVWPDIDANWTNVDRRPDRDAGRTVHAIFRRLDQIDWRAIGATRDTGPDGDPDGLPYLRFDDAGQRTFNEWRGRLEARLRGGEMHPALEAHLAKYRKLVPGLALICHLADGANGPVSERAVLRALAWADYLETHARRAYASVTLPEVAAAKAIIKKLRTADLPPQFSSRDVWRPGWALLSDRDQVVDALELLVDLDWLATTRNKTAGRAATVYHANPRGLRS